jgi:hypothetical protein
MCRPWLAPSSALPFGNLPVKGGTAVISGAQAAPCCLKLHLVFSTSPFLAQWLCAQHLPRHCLSCSKCPESSLPSSSTDSPCKGHGAPYRGWWFFLQLSRAAAHTLKLRWEGLAQTLAMALCKAGNCIPSLHLSSSAATRVKQSLPSQGGDFMTQSMTTQKKLLNTPEDVWPEEALAEADWPMLGCPFSCPPLGQKIQF